MSQLQITDLVLVNSELDQVQDITEYDYRNIMGGKGKDKDKVEVKTETKPDGTTVVTITITR
ncbi:MAG: hypothetical protein EWV76_02165 [Microcystis novacekii Mn_MB_F_20050700_S1]|uniref:Uncharacterized protein n=1 Tax=Microcystis novacekii Mn_MB_F_20050700_S1D TaxID=2486266 RepID=A0A552J1K7_9CHRO|nr:MAG: hypothetical protein EWV54_08275 [Microcystis novacekii Mn_MB_F_20050700_S1D]TRU92438.1 MAG: hypothetical protein EWV76_02165 [Microcystis novacekii Mn_MB_F_20050700_S1]